MPLLLLLSFLLLAAHANPSSHEHQSEQDTVACGELRTEYTRICAATTDAKRRSAKDQDFCGAFENICFSIPRGEPDNDAKARSTTPIPVTTKKRSFTRFCKEFKNRYLYVCPDPFRFGQKAIVFCPVYSEKCQVPLPDRPVIPTRKSSARKTGGIEELCRSYRGFATTYCSNPFLTSQAQYRAACDKYWRYCSRTHRNG